jgi:two-component system chemotaxis sensor kinase CheA
MFELAEADTLTSELTADLTSMTDRIDEISTRLIIDGVQSVVPADFHALAQMANDLGRQCAADTARRIAHTFAPPAVFSIPDLTRLLSSGLVELRSLLENPEAAPCAPAATGDSLDATAPMPYVPESPTSQTNPLAADLDLVREFITESGEHLVAIEGHMLALENNRSAAEPLNAVFRAFHTIKGLAGLLEFSAIQSLAHEVETLLDLCRNGQLAVDPTVVDVVLESADVVRREFANIELRLAGKPPLPTSVDDPLLERIRATARGEASDAPTPSPVPQPAALETPAPLRITEVPAASATTAPTPIAPALQAETAPALSQPAPNKPAAEPIKAADSISVRIDTAKLDQLMDMVGEMVIAQTLIGHSPVLATVQDPRFRSDLTQLARITADVQRITTGMRMVPIGIQFQKTARMIRDLSRRAGKQIVLETSGEDTELDKTIAEELSDPLLHMVRNSVDHGIEPPEERIAAGKDTTAHIRVSAYHQSGQIVVAISDDGRGLNREKILAKAVQNGLIHSTAQLSDNEIFQLIFEPGFSTADKVTDISGRGVGMDVVRRHVQKLRGRIDIQSKAGQGTTFFLKLPLTLAIIEGLVVVVGAQRYIAPIFSVREMFRPTPEMLSTVQGTREMVMVRGGLLPIVRLHQRFSIEPRTTALTEGTLIVAESQGHQFCLFVDDLVGKQEVVIKSLGQSFKDVVGIAGCAILGDGRVGLILDIEGVFKGRQ